MMEKNAKIYVARFGHNNLVPLVDKIFDHYILVSRTCKVREL